MTAMAEKVRLSLRQSRKLRKERDRAGFEIGLALVKGDELVRAGIGGADIRSTPFTTEKSAVLAPMPRASVRTAMSAKPGFLRSVRGGVAQVLQEFFELARAPLVASDLLDKRDVAEFAAGGLLGAFVRTRPDRRGRWRPSASGSGFLR